MDVVEANFRRIAQLAPVLAIRQISAVLASRAHLVDIRKGVAKSLMLIGPELIRILLPPSAKSAVV